MKAGLEKRMDTVKEKLGGQKILVRQNKKQYEKMCQEKEEEISNLKVHVSQLQSQIEKIESETFSQKEHRELQRRLRETQSHWMTSKRNLTELTAVTEEEREDNQKRVMQLKQEI